MRKLIDVMLCTFLIIALVGCANKDKQKEDTPGKEESNTEPSNKENVDTLEKTMQGKIRDATSLRFTIETDSGVAYSFDRSQMELKDTALVLGEVIKVTYIEKDGDKVAKKGEILSGQITMEPSKSTIDEIIEHMSIEEKVGQMFFVRCPNDQEISDINTYHIGGYILFDKDFNGKSYQDVVNTLDAYQKASTIPLLIGVDEEGGTVNRLSRYSAFRAVPFWSSQALYEYGGLPFIESDVKDKAQLLKGLGINVNLAPVADVSTNPSDFIYARSFGQNAQETSEYVRVVVREMKADKIGSTLKHFPGYGNNVDTHTGIAKDERSYESFQKSDFLPFKAGIDAGADSVLVSHNIMTCVDKDHPASLSLKVHELLRNELGFTGVIMTDDLYMDAIKKYINDDEAAVSAMIAGNDLLLCSNYRVQLPAVIKAVKNGVINESQLDASVKRILQWKANLGLIDID